MPKIKFKTNLDKYQGNCFPSNLEIPPRVGEKVAVVEGFISHYMNRKLPTTLEVVDVLHTEKLIVCELWYSKTDILSAEVSNVDLF